MMDAIVPVRVCGSVNSICMSLCLSTTAPAPAPHAAPIVLVGLATLETGVALAGFPDGIGVHRRPHEPHEGALHLPVILFEQGHQLDERVSFLAPGLPALMGGAQFGEHHSHTLPFQIA